MSAIQPVINRHHPDSQVVRNLLERVAKKRHAYPLNSQNPIVRIADPTHLSAREINLLQQTVDLHNFAIYQYDENEPAFHHGYQHLCHQVGLVDSIANPAADKQNTTTIRVIDHDRARASRYIPFSTRALKWHTDGYYNSAPDRVQAFVLHCQQPAVSGGETALVDHELIYAMLYQENPQWLDALLAADIMTIPANKLDGRTIRPAYSGPVFEFAPQDDSLVMRYTERHRHIGWSDKPETQAALAVIQRLLAGNHPWICRHTLQRGQGIITNNVLHNRSAFEDSAQHPRKLQRIRFRNRIQFGS